MDIGLQFELIYKDADVIQIRISAWNGLFGGTADVYAGIGRLEEIAATIAGFPDHPSDTRDIVVGAFGPDWAGGGASMRFYCADATGHAYVDAKIESDSSSAKSTQSVSLSLPIEAAAVDSFVRELRVLASIKTGSARLEGLLQSSC